MPRATKRVSARRDRKIVSPRTYPNRIHELSKLREMTYADVADRVGGKAHGVTIAKLATGKMQLTHDWMKRLAKALDVEVPEIISKPIGAGLRRVRVRGRLKAGVFSEGYEWPDDDQYDVMIRDVPALRRAELYAAEIEGDSMNLRYPHGSVVVMSAGGSDLTPGRRYHVKITRPDGTSEETIKTLERGEDGRYWLKPESSNPEFQAWIPLDGFQGATVELVGRVRFAVQRED
jgi:phage repressor protein C with HTH and peptisase S24 domain